MGYKIVYKRKSTRDRLKVIMLLYLFTISMLKISGAYIFVGLILGLIVLRSLFSYDEKKDKEYYYTSKTASKFSGILLIGLSVFLVLQSIILKLKVMEVYTEFLSLSILFIGLFIIYIAPKIFTNFELYIGALDLFLILFSTLYLILIIVNGLPDERNSALGYFSSNYCAAIIFVSYPAIFYYLEHYAPNNYKVNNIKPAHYYKSFLAILLSLCVIISSGSRSALAAVVFEFIVLFFLKKKSLKEIIKTITFLLFVLTLLYLAYRTNTQIASLFDRATSALRGTKGFENDIRHTVWLQAISDFNHMNKFMGSASLLVVFYGRPAHNVIIEIIMMTGYIGITIFVIYLIGIFNIMTKHKDYNKVFYILLTVCVGAIVGYVQPFFTTGYTFNILLWSTIFSISLASKNGKPDNIVGENQI